MYNGETVWMEGEDVRVSLFTSVHDLVLLSQIRKPFYHLRRVGYDTLETSKESYMEKNVTAGYLK